jgi:hypothetical protein
MEDVTGQGQGREAAGEAQPNGVSFDASVAHPARIYNYWLGGKDNFAADRRAAQEVLDVMPVIAQVARSNRMFLSTAVHYLVAQVGIRQFLSRHTRRNLTRNSKSLRGKITYESWSRGLVILSTGRQGRGLAWLGSDWSSCGTSYG